MFKVGDKVKRLKTNGLFNAGDIFLVVQTKDPIYNEMQVLNVVTNMRIWGDPVYFELINRETSKEKAEKFLKLLCK